MIGYISGTILDTTERDCLVLTSHIGYLVSPPERTLRSLTLNQTVQFYTHHHIKEDSQTLFGFETRDEKHVFEKLITVNGVGPRLALSLLSAHTIHSLAHAIESGNSSALYETPGVGKKTAEKIILELQGKLETYTHSTSHVDPLMDVRLALLALGYTQRDIGPVLESLQTSGKDTNVLIKDSLALLHNYK